MDSNNNGEQALAKFFAPLPRLLLVAYASAVTSFVVALVAYLGWGQPFLTWLLGTLLVMLAILTIWGIWYRRTGGFNSLHPPRGRHRGPTLPLDTRR